MTYCVTSNAHLKKALVVDFPHKMSEERTGLFSDSPNKFNRRRTLSFKAFVLLLICIYKIIKLLQR